MRPLFTTAQVGRYIDEFKEDAEKKLYETLVYIGERAVKIARESGNYRDRTGNLRSSVGYMIFHNGTSRKSNYTGKGTGISAGKALAKEVASNYKGYVLIITAGMEYAARVEMKGYDVITGSSVQLKSIANQIIKGL